MAICHAAPGATPATARASPVRAGVSPGGLGHHRVDCSLVDARQDGSGWIVPAIGRQYASEGTPRRDTIAAVEWQTDSTWVGRQYVDGGSVGGGSGRHFASADKPRIGGFDSVERQTDSNWVGRQSERRKLLAGNT